MRRPAFRAKTLAERCGSHDVEGVVAKRRDGIYRPGYRGWTKIKNPSYWRRESEIDSCGVAESGSRFNVR